MVTQNSLDSLAFFASLDHRTREAVGQQCRWRRFAPHEQIIDRQDEGRDVYFLVEGRVRVVNYSLSGREISFDDLDPGSYFGELSAIDGLPRSANVIALTDSLVLIMPQGVFERTVTEHPALALSVMKNLAQVVRRATERIMDLSTLGANNRVHAEILRLAKAQTEDGQSAVVKPIPVHGDIASRVSTTRETVARVFGDLARTGLVQRQSDHLLITDLAELQEMVEDVRGDGG